MEIINSIFGKSEGITKQEFEKEFIHSKIQENYLREFKSIGSFSDDEKEKSILKPIIGFLNSNFGKGLLVLGLRQESQKNVPVPINVNIIRNTEQLKNMILDSISIIPLRYTFAIFVEKITFENGAIFLIEVSRLNENQIFYSLKTGVSYQRIDHQTKIILPSDLIKLITLKNYPRVRVVFEMSSKTETMKTINVVLHNEGVRPAKYGCGIITFNTPVKINPGHNIRQISLSDANKQVFEFNFGTPPTHKLLYPSLPMIAGSLVIPNEDLHIDVIVKVYTEDTRSDLMIQLDSYKDLLVRNIIHEDYNSYLGLL